MGNCYLGLIETMKLQRKPADLECSACFSMDFQVSRPPNWPKRSGGYRNLHRGREFAAGVLWMRAPSG